MRRRRSATEITAAVLPQKQLDGFVARYKKIMDDLGAAQAEWRAGKGGSYTILDRARQKALREISPLNDVFWDFIEEHGAVAQSVPMFNTAHDNFRDAEVELARLTYVAEAIDNALWALSVGIARLNRSEKPLGSVEREMAFRVDRPMGGDEAHEEAKVSSGLICMGREIAFVGKNFDIEAPMDNGMLYDASGEWWPNCSLLVTKFKRGRKIADNSDANAYFGKKTKVTQGAVELPPRSLKEWKKVGPLVEIFYDRAGDRAPGPFRHEFNKPRGLWRLIHLVKGEAASAPAILYRRRNIYRVELPDGCVVDDRGIAVP